MHENIYSQETYEKLLERQTHDCKLMSNDPKNENHTCTRDKMNMVKYGYFLI